MTGEGIDYFLPDFQKENSSRILFLWDQSLMPEIEKGWKPPLGYRTGVEFTREQINRALAQEQRKEALEIVPQQDFSGHGTGVAAIAASSNSEVLLTGVAPECDLLVVKLKAAKESGFPASTELMRAVTYVIQKSLEINRPLVINLSFGNTYGSHDGTSLLERFLDDAAEIGRTSICVGAGNEGSSGGHFSGNVKQINRIELAVAQRESTVNVQFWKSYEDRFQITLETPGGQEFQIQNFSTPGKQEWVYEQTKILVYAGVPTPYSTKQEIFFAFLPQEDYINSGIWSFNIKEEKVTDGEFQMYLPAGKQRNTGTRFLLQNPNLTMTIPATSQRVISVAAYNDNLDSYADFSGRGRQIGGYTYLAGEGNKPDIAAPGVGILASKAGGGTESYTGTSFAAPIAAGSVALLMEWGIVNGNDPYLYGEKVKAYLRGGAKTIRGEERYPNNKIGWGILCTSDSIPEK